MFHSLRFKKIGFKGMNLLSVNQTITKRMYKPFHVCFNTKKTELYCFFKWHFILQEI